MTRSRAVLAAVLLSLPAGQVEAAVPPESPVAAKSFRDARLDIPTRLEPMVQTPSGLVADAAFQDPRAGRVTSLVVSEPLFDARPADDAALRAAVWDAILGYVARNRSALRLDSAELAPPNVGVFEHGDLILAFAPRRLHGIVVRDSGLTAVVNHGNLVLLGLQNWGDAGSPAEAPRVGTDAARLAVSEHVRPFVVDSFGDPHLEYVPMTKGDGYEYRLVWAVRATVADDLGGWEGLVDATSGALLAFEDQNRYAARKAMGGVYPVSNDQRPPDGIEQADWPLPFLKVTTPMGMVTTNSGGVIGCATGTVSTALSGQYTRVNDSCGAVSESAATGDLDLGSGPPPPASDCAVPPGHSAGDTKSARTAFYTLTRASEHARGWLSGLGWLDEPLLANLNTQPSCQAFWSGSAVHFYREAASCRNTGENASQLAHEWGHGLDDNGVNPTISMPAEAIADIHSALIFGQSCVGRGIFRNMVCAGYGDGCIGTAATGCTSVRDIDFTQHRCNRPHTVTWALNGFTSAECGGSGPAGACPTGSGGPCGRLRHCEGMIASEAVWDLQARDLRAAPFNLDGPTALELATRLNYLGTQVLTSWNTCAVGGGCAATGGYLLFLAVDDDDGNIANGTPHMTAIRSAFERHEIHCATPAPANSGCAAGPTTAPVVGAVAGDGSAMLSWNAVSGAARYYVYRAEGVNGPDSPRVKIDETSETAFADGALQNGRTYYFSVLPAGANTSCLGRMSNSAVVVPGPAARLALRPPTALSIAGGDADGFLDNCETATVTFPVDNAGAGALTNVRIVGVAFLSHPSSVLQTTLPAPVAATLGSCGIGSGSFTFVLQGGTSGQATQIRVDVTADELSGQTQSQVLTLGPVEHDPVHVATRTYDFDATLSGWTVASGRFDPEAAGASGTARHLHSSAALDNQCDRVRSPLLRLRPGSTLSLQSRYDVEAPSPSSDRANVGVVRVGPGTRTTIAPSGGRPYELSPGTPNGVCVTADQGGWTGTQPAFAASTWDAGALNPGGAFTGAVVQLEVAHGTDSINAQDGFRFDEVTLTDFDDLGADTLPNTCGAGASLTPVALAVDPGGNSVMEPNEMVIVAPTWRNVGATPITLTGATSGFTGPAGPVYTNPDNTASYGTIGIAAQASCATGGDCYSVNTAAATRPGTHWDTTILETVNPSATTKTWTLHVGNSFTDVPPSNPFYRFIETVLHRAVTGGCTTTTYCPTASATREQMAVFVLVAREGPSFNPQVCVAGSERFSDVPASSPFCKWIEEIARRLVVGGCSPTTYCPSVPVTREQMAVFALKTADPPVNPPPCGTPMFNDVPAASPFCRWIEELARRGVVSGCGGGNYCPTPAVTRQQMSVFLTVTFGLTLYGL